MADYSRGLGTRESSLWWEIPSWSERRSLGYEYKALVCGSRLYLMICEGFVMNTGAQWQTAEHGNPPTFNKLVSLGPWQLGPRVLLKPASGRPEARSASRSQPFT